MSESQHRVGLRDLETIGHIAPLDGLQPLVKAASEQLGALVTPDQTLRAPTQQAAGRAEDEAGAQAKPHRRGRRSGEQHPGAKEQYGDPSHRARF